MSRAPLISKVGWKTSLLDLAAKRGSGHTPSQKHPEYWNGGIAWISLADSSALDKRYIAKTAKNISALGIRHSSAVIHKKGTVVLSRDAGVGKSAIMAIDMAVSQHFIAWTCEPTGELHNEFLYYWLQLMKSEFERIAVGSTVKTIGLPYFKKLKICYPPFKEQTAIADLLSTWDTTIEKTERLIAAKEKRFEGLVHEVIVRPASRRGAWPKKSIGEIADRVQRKSDGERAYPILTIASASGFVKQETKYRRYMAGESVNNYIMLKKGEFAYNKGNSLRYQFGCVFQLQDYESAEPVNSLKQPVAWKLV